MNKQNRKDLEMIKGVVDGIRGELEGVEGEIPKAKIAEWEGALDDQVGELEGLKDEEQDKFDNMPEGLQSSERGEAMEQAVSDLDEAISAIQGVSSTIGELKGKEKDLVETLSDCANELSEACDSIDSAMGG